MPGFSSNSVFLGDGSKKNPSGIYKSTGLILASQKHRTFIGKNNSMNSSLLFPRLILIAVIGLVYSNTFLNSFHFDDLPSILEKPWIRGLDKIPQFLNKDSLFQRPLVILSFNINYAISEFEVWSYHLFNILLHALATLLVYQLARKVLNFLEDFSSQKSFAILPFFAAMVFALHPLNTQSITYISSRSSTMVTVCYLSALILFFDGFKSGSQTGQKGWAYFIGSGYFFFLGGLTKEIIITFPAMLFLFHFYFISRETPKVWVATYAKWILPSGNSPSHVRGLQAVCGRRATICFCCLPQARHLVFNANLCNSF